MVCSSKVTLLTIATWNKVTTEGKILGDLGATDMEQHDEHDKFKDKISCS